MEKSDLKADESDPQTQTENKDGLVEQNEIPPMIDLELHSQRKLRHAVSALPPKIGSAASRTKSHSMMSNSAVKKWKLEDQIIKEDLEVSLEDLEIQEQICLSKFGAIHHGKLMGIEVQVNFLDKDKLTPHLIDYIKRTLFLVKEIRHPNVLSLLGSHLEDHPNFIVTERCEYGNLASVLFTSENLLNCMVRCDIICFLPKLHRC